MTNARTDQKPDTDTYALKAGDVPEITAPDLPYRPPMPRSYRPKIGLIGAGGIAASHLGAYRLAGWEVATICSRNIDQARARANEFFPDAEISIDAEDVLADPDIDVVDLTPHPADRLPLIEASLRAGKHVLSQKPFVLDLADGERMADLADANGLRLAVNQNGRWSPHHAYLREAVRRGLIGEATSCHVSIHWDHSWIAGTPFERIEDLVLYDFAIHWFDFAASLFGSRIRRVFATAARANGQSARVPLLAQAIAEVDGGQASFVFDGATPFGPHDSLYVAGTNGSLRSEGPDLGTQSVTLTTAEGRATPKLEGTWFTEGFVGAMGELLCAIEDGREPQNGARENLRSLAVAFAAIHSARVGSAVTVGEIRRLVL